MIGDVAFAVKQDQRVKEGLQAIEQEMVSEMFTSIPEFIHGSFRDAYAIVDSEGIQGKFFNAVERLGYILYARDRIEQGDDSFVQVYLRQHTKLLELEQLFVSVRMVYDEHRDHIAQKIQLYEKGQGLCNVTDAHHI